MDKLSVILLYFKEDIEILLNCLDAISKSVGKINYEIILINNNANINLDNLQLQKKYPIKIFLNSYNRGVAKSRNQAVKLSEGDFFLFLDVDMIAKNLAIEKLFNYLKNNPSVGAVGGKILLPDKTLQISFGNLPNGLFFLYELFLIPKKITPIYEPKTVEFLAGGCLLVSRSAWKLVGELDENFYLYGWEDADWCKRAKEKKVKLVYFPQAEFIHLLHKSSLNLRAVEFYLNGIYYFKKHFKRLCAFFALIFIFLFSIFRLFILFIKGKKDKKNLILRLIKSLLK
ncbi:MAG: glycosyltransferase, partial [Candidatus Omnitrophica bacterium]|nr:glycosyltransferase [Candidatus Omnitrophota bacterium]